MYRIRAERRAKTAQIKRALEPKIQRELAFEQEMAARYPNRRRRDEKQIRRYHYRNEGRKGRRCWDCGSHACDWCLEGFYRKYRRRWEALDNDLRDYLYGEYDIVEEGEEVKATAPIPQRAIPRPMRVPDTR